MYTQICISVQNMPILLYKSYPYLHFRKKFPFYDSLLIYTLTDLILLFNWAN